MSFLGRAVLAVALALPLSSAAAGQIHERPQGETPWVTAFHAKARMIAGKPQERNGSTLMLGGVHVALDNGWKTYWRNPGDAGLPPSFDWSGSANVKSVRVLWPAPRRYNDPFGASIGYAKEVVFPILVEPVDRSRPVDLALQFEYAVCKDICIPAEAALKIMFAIGGESAFPHQALIETFLRQVPAEAGQHAKGPHIADLKVGLSPPKPQIVIDAVFPGGARDADLFVEGPDDVYIPLAERVREDPGGRIRFLIDLTKGDDPKGLKGKALTFTLVSANGSTETTRRID